MENQYWRRKREMESDRRNTRVRKPLSDCTNRIAAGAATAASSQSSSSSSFLLRKPRNPNLSSAFAKLLSDLDPKSAKAGPRKNDAASAHHVSVLPPAVSSTPSRPPRSSSASGSVDCEVFEPCSVYTRRRTAEKLKSKPKPTEEPLNNTLTAEKKKSKGKAIDEPLSCPPATKIQKIGEKVKEDGSKSLSKASTVPHKKKQRRIPYRKDSAKYTLSQDYIKQQRAYFAEIDAFELPEEEVESVSDLD